MLFLCGGYATSFSISLRYADDSACAAKLANLRVWFHRLRQLGPDFGYYPEPSKSYLIVHSINISQAQDIFRDSEVQLVSGHRFFGWLCWRPYRVHVVCSVKS